MKKISSKWQKLIIWLTGYLNIIAFVLTGGYFYLHTEDEDVKASAKHVLLLIGGFTGVELLRALIYNCMSLFNASFEALSVISDIGTAIAIIKALAFITLFILDMNGIKLKKHEAPAQDTVTDADNNAA